MGTLKWMVVGLVAVGVLAALLGGGYFAWVMIQGGSGEASEEISAPTLEVPASNTSNESASTAQLFRIVPEESAVRFILEEDLRGERVTVVGETNQVAGDILIDRANPMASQIGTIRINLRTLATDSENRDRAIRAEVLESAKDEYEFTTFVPTAISGLPTSVTIGQPFTVQVTGDFTLREITNTVTFNVTLTPVSDSQLAGMGTAVITRSAYNLNIPSVPFVANVSEEVRLEIEFVAELVDAPVTAPQS